MWYDNRAIDAYRKERGLKEHEKEMLKLISSNELTNFSGEVLDVGCADGNFTRFLAAVFPEAHYTGVDISPELISTAKKHTEPKKASWLVEDIIKWQPAKAFDFIVASGILSVFEDYEYPLKQWLSWLKSGGRLYIFGRFNSSDIDTIIRFRNNFTGGGWQSGMTTYSIHTIGRFLSSLGLHHEFRRFNLLIDLPKQDDPGRTFTLLCSDGSKLIINGANIVSEQYFLIIHKS